MTDRIAEIKARLEALPSEPKWESDWDSHWDVHIYSAWARGRSHMVLDESEDPTPMNLKAEAAEKDAAFIASAPADMRYLLDEVKRLRELIKEHERFNPFVEDWKDPSMDVYNDL